MPVRRMLCAGGNTCVVVLWQCARRMILCSSLSCSPDLAASGDGESSRCVEAFLGGAPSAR
eukprot:7625721-Pyramimonas_sp.AAC.1